MQSTTTSNPTVPRSPQQFDRLPPHSIEAEMCLLGSMMLDRDRIPLVRGMVKATSFYLPDHEIIFAVLCDLHNRDKPIDAVIVREELLRRGKLEEIGGTGYIGQILSAVPSAAHAAHYAGIVREKATWRDCISIANDVLCEAYSTHEVPDAAVTRARLAASRFAECSARGVADGFRRIGDIVAEVGERVEQGHIPFIPTGIAGLDKRIGGIPIGGFTQVGGRPGMGKSQMVKQIALNIAQRGLPVAILSVEETDAKIGANYLAAMSGVQNSKIIAGRVGKDEWAPLTNGLSRLDRLPIFVNDDVVTLSEIAAAVTLAVAKYKCAAVIIDYLQLIDSEARENENREITLVSKSLKGVFKRLNVAGIAAVQLNRGNEGPGGGAVRRPVLRDLRGSGSLEQDGDLILLLHREDYYHRGDTDYRPTNQLQCIIAKNKSGPTSNVPLLFSGDTQTITDWASREVVDPFAG